MTHDDKVILLPWASTHYIVNVICHECKGKKEFVKPSNVSLGNYNDSVLKDKIKLQDTDDEGQTDVESDDVTWCSSGDEDEEDDITAGNLVWGMSGRMWYTAKVCSLNDVPENMRDLFLNNR